jgi:hypothetical protein
VFDSYIVHHHCTCIVCCSISNTYSTNFHVSVFFTDFGLLLTDKVLKNKTLILSAGFHLQAPNI